MKEELHSRLVPVLVDVVDATSVEGRGPTDDAMDLRSDGKETSRNDERIANELSWISKRNHSQYMDYWTTNWKQIISHADIQTCKPFRANLTIYPFERRSSVRYEPSWPVIPVTRAIFFESAIFDVNSGSGMFYVQEVREARGIILGHCWAVWPRRGGHDTKLRSLADNIRQVRVLTCLYTLAKIS